MSEMKIEAEMRDAFNLIRKTNDFGGIIADSGKGKTRGIEMIMKGERAGDVDRGDGMEQ
jgi:hypothetical protein